MTKSINSSQQTPQLVLVNRLTIETSSNWSSFLKHGDIQYRRFNEDHRVNCSLNQRNISTNVNVFRVIVDNE